MRSPPQERAASLELAGRRTSPETRSALPGKRLWPRLCRWQTGRMLGTFRGTNREPGRLVESLHEPAYPPVQTFVVYATKVRHARFMASMRDWQMVAVTHEPERRFVTGLARPIAPSRLETGAPPRCRGTHRERSFVDSLHEPHSHSYSSSYSVRAQSIKPEPCSWFGGAHAPSRVPTGTLAGGTRRWTSHWSVTRPSVPRGRGTPHARRVRSFPTAWFRLRMGGGVRGRPDTRAGSSGGTTHQPI